MPDGSEPRELDLRDYLRVLRRRRSTIALIVFAVVGGTVAFSLLQTRVYKATTQVLVTSTNQTSQGTANDQTTELILAQAPTVRDAATRALGHVPDISISSSSTSVIAISAQSNNARQAAKDANTYARVYIESRRKQAADQALAAGQQVQAQIDQLNAQSQQLDNALAATPPTQLQAVIAQQASQRSRIAAQLSLYTTQLNQIQSSTTGVTRQVLAQATPPGSPVRPAPLRDGLIALAVGLVLAVAAAFAREHFDDSVKTKEDVERFSGGLAVIGLIPGVKYWKDRKIPEVVSSTAVASRAAEGYRTLRTSLQFLGLDRPIRAIQITSPNPDEGKTTTVANLAVTTGRADRQVVVVGGDLRRPRVHKFFGLTNEVGLTSVLLGEVTLEAALQRVDAEPNVSVLAAGPPPPNPADLLSLDRTAEVFQELRSWSELLLVDSTPVLPVTDALILSNLVDATLVVTTAGSTTGRDLQRAIEVLRQVDAPLAGAVLNYPASRRGYAYAYAYGYAYGYGPQRGSANGRVGRKARKAAARAEKSRSKAGQQATD